MIFIICEKDIKIRLAEVLENNGFNVVATEIDEGFQKPAVFINVYPSEMTRECSNVFLCEDEIEIKYIPSIETTEECGRIAKKIKEMLMFQPFEIADRKLTIETIKFEIDKHILFVYFYLAYRQIVEPEQDYEETTNLEMELNY